MHSGLYANVRWVPYARFRPRAELPLPPPDLRSTKPRHIFLRNTQRLFPGTKRKLSVLAKGLPPFSAVVIGAIVLEPECAVFAIKEVDALHAVRCFQRGEYRVSHCRG